MTGGLNYEKDFTLTCVYYTFDRGGLTSCQNFLTGGEIKQQIEDEIARANAKKIDIRIAVDSPEYGSVYPTQVTVIKGDSFSLEFTKASDAGFLEWVCVDSSTNMVLDDAVTFTNQSGEKNKLTVTAQLNCESENLVIKPHCYFATEETKPEFKTLRLARTEEDAINGINLISFDAFTHYATKTTYGGDTAQLAEGIREHHVNSLWVYVEADDDSSGVGEFIIKEEVIRKQDGTAVPTATGLKTVFENPSMSRDLKKAFKLDFKTGEDGVLKLSFSIKDRAGNSSEYGNTVDVVKDTSFSASFVLLDVNPKIAESSPFNYTYSFPILFPDRLEKKEELLPCFIVDADGGKHYKISSLPKPEDDDYNVNVDYNYYEKFDVSSVYWGYDENNMKPVDSISIEHQTIDYLGAATTMEGAIEGDFPQVSFTVDRRKNVCVKVIAKDACGNVSESVGYISKGIDILSCKEESDSWTLTLSGTLDSKNNFYIDGTEESWYTGFYVVYTDPSGQVSRPRIVSTFPTSSSTSEIELTKIVYGEDSDVYSTQVNISDLPDGTYEIYCMPTAAYVFFIFFVPTFSSAAGKPYTIYKGVTPPADPNPTTADLPSSFTVNVDPPVKNTGKRNVHVSYPSGFTPNPKLNYAIKYSNSKNTVSEFSISKDFEIPTQYCSWNFEIHAFNSSGKSVCTSPVSIDLTSSAENDNLPPTANLTLKDSSLTDLTFSYTRQNLPFVDDEGGSGIKSSSSGGGIRAVYTVSFEYTLAHESGLEDKIDWTGDGIKTATYEYDRTTSERTFSVSLLGLSGTYLYMRVFDNNGNYLVYRYPYKVLKMVEKPYAKKSGSTLYVYCDRGNTDKSCNIIMKYCSGNKWEEIPEHSTMGLSGNTFYRAVSLTTEQKNTFVFARPWYKTDAIYKNGELKTEGQIVIYNSLYFCPAYYLETDFKCRQKNFIEGSRGIEILSDKPVLVHTFYSTYDYGNSYEKWLENALETGVRSEPSSFTYDYDNLYDVPAGNYYTTIIHYADGTVDMTKVKRM